MTPRTYHQDKRATEPHGIPAVVDDAEATQPMMPVNITELPPTPHRDTDEQRAIRNTPFTNKPRRGEGQGL
jgi:hypothetical protein